MKLIKILFVILLTFTSLYSADVPGVGWLDLKKRDSTYLENKYLVEDLGELVFTTGYGSSNQYSLGALKNGATFYFIWKGDSYPDSVMQSSVYCNNGDSYNASNKSCYTPEPCTDTIPDGAIGYPSSSPGVCEEYTESMQEIYAQAPGTICATDCYSFPYDDTTCTAPKILDTNTTPPTCKLPNSPDSPTCLDNEFLDINNTCTTPDFPDGFPEDTEAGTPNIEKHSMSQDDCIAGEIYKSGISYVETLGWDYGTNKCVFATYFCSNGLTFNSTTKKCEIPASESDGSSDDISQDLQDSCSSGKWVKRWTNDYCGNSLCVIPPSLDNYNLQCGNKYLEYDCTSNYQLKYFKQVSCGPVSKDNYNDFNLSLDSSSDIPINNLPVDSNSSINNLDIASIINSGVSGINNNLDGLIKSNSDLNNKISSNGETLKGINSKLDNLSQSLNPDSEQDRENLDLAFTSFEDYYNSVKDSYDLVTQNFDDTKLLLESGFQYSPPSNSCVDPSINFHGSVLKLSICEPLAKFRPFVYFFLMISFTILAIKIFLLGLSI